mgnify:CR=1 FL=1
MRLETAVKPIEILLVEDNPGDVRLAREALKDGKVLNNLMVAEDGEVALQMLRKEGKYRDSTTPDIVLLDLNLPKKDGLEVLQEIKSDPDLKVIPVVILTTSESDEDILKSYKLHANCYITKPVDLLQFLQVIKTIESFWVSIVSLPTKRKCEKIFRKDTT